MNNYFNTVYGQESAKNILTKLVESSKVPHAFLFHGVEGSGKDFTAIRFIQFLNNDHPAAVNAVANLAEPFIKYIIPLPRGKNETESSGPLDKLTNDEIKLLKTELSNKIANPYYRINIPKANNIKISSIRDIKKFLSFNYEDVRYRVVLISGAHLMNEEAQNALLKGLEEPPPNIIFILTTPYPDQLRETIRSRCWSVNFQPLHSTHISEILTGNFNIQPELAKMVSVFSGGSVSEALDLLDHDFEKLLDKTIHILRYSFGRKYNSALNQFNEVISDNSVDSVRLVIQLIITWLNDIIKFRYGKTEFYFSSHYETLEKFNKKFPDLEVSSTVYVLERLISSLRYNANVNTVVLNVIFELAQLTRQNPKTP